MTRLDDGDLWRTAQRGEADAFATLFDRHAPASYGYCFRRTADCPSPRT